jgi:hypothetical protein
MLIRGRRQSGQALVLVAFALLALIGSAALVLLAGSAAWQRNQLQTLADSTALDAALKVGIGCNAAGANTVITEADNFLATQRARTGALAIAAGTCATPYHGTDTFTGGLSADYYFPYKAHQLQVEVALTLTLPISFGGVVGKSTTTLTRYAVAQALPGSTAAVTATTLGCTGGQVNVAGDIRSQNAITLAGACAFYAHDRASAGSFSGLGNVRAYTDGQAWVSGGACVAGANAGSTNAICADGYELSGHTAPACGGVASQFLTAANALVNASPCAAGVNRPPVPPVPSTLPPDPNTDASAIATLTGTGGAACSAAGVYPNIVVGGSTVGTGLAPAPIKDAAGYYHFKPSCYGYLNAGALPGAGITNRQTGIEAGPVRTTITATLPGASIAGTLLVVVITSKTNPSHKPFTAPASWTQAVTNLVDGAAHTDIWYYRNNPGGISGAAFGISPGSIDTVAQMTEWSGVLAAAPLDRTGTASVAVAQKTATVSTSLANTAANDLVITNIGYAPAGAGNTYTPGAGWSALASDLNQGFASEYRTDLPAAVASETVTYTSNTTWSGVIASFKPAAGGAAAAGAVLDPGFYYFNGSGFGGGGGICLNGGQLLARDVTVEFVNQAGFSTGTCVAGGGAGCAAGPCKFGSDPASGPVDTSFTWFAGPCSQDPTASPDVSCLGASSWCPTGDRSCWNLLLYTPASATGQVALKAVSNRHWLLGSVFWAGTVTDSVNGTSTLAGNLTCGTLSISSAAGVGTAIGSDYGISTATVEAVLVE